MWGALRSLTSTVFLRLAPLRMSLRSAVLSFGAAALRVSAGGGGGGGGAICFGIGEGAESTDAGRLLSLAIESGYLGPDSLRRFELE